MVSLAVLHRSDTDLAFLAATEDASALAATLAASQPFEVEVFAEFPHKGDLLPTVQSILGSHAKGWYTTDPMSIVKAVCLAVKGSQTEVQTPDSTSDGNTSQDAEDRPPGADRQASPDSDESSIAQPSATQSKPRRSRSPRKTAASNEAKKQIVAETNLTAAKIPPKRKPSTGTQQPSETKETPEPSAAINPAWHDLLTACPRDEADTATTIRRTLKRLLGRWQADSVLSAYSERILRIGGVCGRYILNAEGATLKLTALAA